MHIQNELGALTGRHLLDVSASALRHCHGTGQCCTAGHVQNIPRFRARLALGLRLHFF